MRRQKHWILLSGPHITNTYIPAVTGDTFDYLISPLSLLRKGDIVYLWLNYDKILYGWGEVVETPQIIYEELTAGDGEIRKRKRQLVKVHRKHQFEPRITEDMMLRHRHLRKLIPTGFDDLYAVPLTTVQAHYINDFVREHGLEGAPAGSAPIRWLARETSPQFIVQAMLTFGGEVPEGRLVERVNLPWYEILKIIRRDPEEIYRIDWRTWEEIVAGAYDREGAEVILTPRSNDKGRDVIATFPGSGTIRIFDQVKRYSPSNVVTAEEVRALIGTLVLEGNVSKGIITTTSTFAPDLLKDPQISGLIPYRLDLRPKNILLPWLEGLI